MLTSSQHKAKNDMPDRQIKHISFAGYILTFNPTEIRFRGNLCKLQPKQALALEILAKNQHRGLHKDEIKAFVWPDKEISDVSDDTFWQLILTLRKAIGDTEKNIIVKVERNIYALKPKATIRHIRTKKEKSNIIKRSLVIAVLVTAATFLTIQYWPKDKTYEGINYQTLTSLKGQITSTAISPDKKNIIFTHRSPNEKNWSLIAKRLGTELKSEIVPADKQIGTQADYNAEPSFSPSGEQIAWVKTDYESYCSVLTANFNATDLTISNQKKVLDCSYAYYARSPQWRTENSLLVSLPVSSGKPSGIFEVDLKTNERYVVTSPSGVGYGDYGLYYNAKKDLIAHIRLTFSSGNAGTELLVYDFSTRQDRLVKTYQNALYSVSWLNDSSLIAKGDEGLEVVHLDGTSVPLKTQTTSPQNYHFAMGPNKIGYVKGALHSSDINIINVANNSNSLSLSSAAYDATPVIAKETDEIAFISDRNDVRQVFYSKGNRLIQLTHYAYSSRITDIAISPNGKYIAYSRLNQLKVISNTGAELYTANVVDSGFSFSRDSKSLLFGVQTESDTLIKQLSLDNFKEALVTRGIMPKTDGSGDIFYLKQANQSVKPTLFKITPEGGISQLTTAPFLVVKSSSFDIMNGQLYYVKTYSDGKKLISQDLESGKIKIITPITANQFSINESATIVVTTKKVQPQNNLASFEVIEK